MVGLEWNIQAQINHGSAACVILLNLLTQSSINICYRNTKLKNAYCIVNVASWMGTHDQSEHKYSKVSRDWIWTDRGLKPGDKIRCLQAFSNTTPNIINKTRGESDMQLRKCRQCKEELDDDKHILSKCKLSNGLITKRHDHLV